MRDKWYRVTWFEKHEAVVKAKDEEGAVNIAIVGQEGDIKCVFRPPIEVEEVNEPKKQ